MSQRQITTYVPERTEDNDPDLWPQGWDVGPHPALPDVGWEYIRPDLLRYYRRTAAGDAEALKLNEAANGTGFNLPDPDNLLHRNGRPIPVDLDRDQGRELLCHFVALKRAKERKDAERRVELETTRDRVEFTCAACGRLDRVEVRSRVVGAWGHRREEPIRPEVKVVERGPRMCDACYRVAEMFLEDRRRDLAVAAAGEEVDGGGTRGDRLRLWFDDNIERMMKS